MPDLKRLLNIQSPIILASGSPRRKQLLESIGLVFQVFRPELDEPPHTPGTLPSEYVEQLSKLKLESCIDRFSDDYVIITADTVVSIDNKILGKPNSPEEAITMLGLLSDNTHTVYTGYSIAQKKSGITVTRHCATDVYFRRLEDSEIKDYVDGGSPMDKAGSYGIQDDLGAVFVEKINGDYFNVVGLPVSMVYNDLKKFTW